MGKKTNKQLIALIITFFIFGLSFTSTGMAANNISTIKGWFADIKIFTNNKQVQLDVKPFVINGTTFVPVRALSEMLNKDVSWNQESFSIDITDKLDTNHDYMLMQITEKQEEIDKLEAKIKKLEAELASKESSISSITDMGKYLNKKHYTYKDIRFYIYLSGNSRDIKVKIYIDSSDNSKWDALTDLEITRYIEDIVYDIEYNFRDANIAGYIESDYSGKKAADFYLNSKGKLEVDTSYSSGIYDLDDMEDYLNSKFSRYQSVDFNVKLYWDLNSIRVDVFVGDNEWYELGSDYRDKYLKDIVYNEINREFPYEGIYGYIFDNFYKEPYTNYTIQSFKFDSNGKLTLE